MNLNNKSIIVIGTSGNLLNYELGKKIDKFDIVIRANIGVTKDYEKYVGTKHTIWQSTKPYWHYISLKKGTKNPKYKHNLTQSQKNKILKQLKEVWAIIDSEKYYKAYELDLHGYDIKFKLSSFGVHKIVNNTTFCQFKNKHSGKMARPNNGSLTIWALTQLVDTFYIAGIDFCGWLSGEKYRVVHYYNSHIKDDYSLKEAMHNPYYHNCHNFKADAYYVNSLIKAGIVTKLKEDTIIKKAKMIHPLENTKCRFCKNPMKIYRWQSNICSKCII